MSEALYPVVGVDIGKDAMHLVALDRGGAVAHRQRCTRSVSVQPRHLDHREISRWAS